MSKASSLLALVEHIDHEDGKWVLRSKKTGKVLGRHPSKKKALAQERAIEIAKHGK